jgi:hypothetical protein
MGDMVAEGVLGVYDTLRRYDAERGAFGVALRYSIDARMRRFAERDTSAPIPIDPTAAVGMMGSTVDWTAGLIEWVEVTFPGPDGDFISHVLLGTETRREFAKRHGQPLRWSMRVGERVRCRMLALYQDHD